MSDKPLFVFEDTPSYVPNENRMKEIVWYLSGPMTGYEDYNYPAFVRAAKSIREGYGFKLVSPNELSLPKNSTWDAYMRANIESIVKRCSGIILLQGWPNSTGACLEWEIARALKFPAFAYVEHPTGSEMVALCHKDMYQ